MKVDGSGKHLELEGAFRRDAEDASDSWPSVLAADDAQTGYDDVVVPEAARLDHQIDEIGDRVKELRQINEARTTGLREHPEATSQLKAIERELNPLSDMPEIHQELSRLLAPRHEPDLQRGVEHGPDLGIDIGF